ncbi:rRNA pseudouridine synthase [Candidatus Saccharibacteria bacterium]|nr:MAG: rRNA pseudouridine synthase [Candidatus Saccharibacteria bacterium]
MRINKFIASATGLSRRTADVAIANGRVRVNGEQPNAGDQITSEDVVTLDGKQLQAKATLQTILLNKPVGYIVSRDGQGGQTVYDLLPANLHHLKPVGRLDKDSSGLLVLTNDGDLANRLTHPSYQKEKVYQISLDKPLAPADQKAIEQGVQLEDGVSKLKLEGAGKDWKISMSEGRNRQIRRTFSHLHYRVVSLHRHRFGSYQLDNLKEGSYQSIDTND